MTAVARAQPPYITAKGRDLRIDLLRGFFVFAMVIDHVCGQSPLWYLSGGNRFFTSAAEGFLLISGLVAGLVYGRLIGRDGLGHSLMKMLKRAFKLYLLTVALTLAFMPVSELLQLPWAEGLAGQDPITLIVSIVTLHRTYHLADVMLIYTLLFLTAPLALLLLDQGKRWWLLGASWLLWGLFQLWPSSAALPWPIASNSLFQFSAWQVIFFTGLAFGYGRPTMPVPQPRRARWLLALTGVALLGLIALYAAVYLPLGTVADITLPGGTTLRTLVDNLFLDKANVRPGRLLATGVTFSFLFLAVTVCWQQVRRAAGWLLLPLGQQSLYAYTVHIGFVALAALALAPIGLGNAPQWLNALVQAGTVGAIWLLARYQVLAPTPRTQPLYNLSPALLAVAAAVVLFLVPSPASNVEALSQVAAAAAVNRFGTPLPAPPAANPFGTPLPPSTPAPLTAASSPSQAQAMARVARWVSKIEGTLEERWFHSTALGSDMPCWAYLPPGYETSGQRYPVLYLLHGAGGHRDEWISYGVVGTADREMAAGTMPPMIIIMPQGDKGFWVNNVGGPSWGDYVTKDLVDWVDRTYRTTQAPGGRAVGGLSMGGYGALTLAFTHPDVFGVVGAHTPSLHTQSKDVAFLGTGAEFAQRDPVALAGTLSGLDRLRIWIDIANHDNWLARAQELHDVLTSHGIAHEWQVLPGTHEGSYWEAHVADYLHFYAGALTPQ